ncbi:MAG: DPP IV N-terminal domain-containing protein [Acidobacteria bacterium]|nr:DPP IV N-terminal domain-containing protein [Acidobacteriota bacterium]
MIRKLIFCSLAFFLFLTAVGYAQGTLADYERAAGLREKYVGVARNLAERANWIEKTNRFWYRKAVKGGNEFVLWDAETLAKRPAFDHERLAAALSAATGEKYTALKLPFQEITFVDGEKAITFTVGETRWRCELADYTFKKLPADERFGQRRGGIPLSTGLPGPRYNFPQTNAKVSPDGKWEAWVNNFNVWVRAKGKGNSKDGGAALSFDGSEGNYYALASLVWSSDSKMIAAYRVRPGYNRKIQYVESSPADQTQPKYYAMDYAKPGDALDQPQPVLFHVEGKQQFTIDNALFPNPYQLSRIEWRKDNRAFTFEYNQRGHQVYRIIEVDAANGKPRAVISEEPKTFFTYSSKKYRYDLADGKEVIWMSERDGWNHLYLFDGVTGTVKNQITKGNWVVRGVEKVDEEKRQIWFQASGMYAGKDPYFIHYYRINFDGTGLTALTEADANHTVSFSSDMKFYVDTWSRVDQPTVSELRQTADKKLLTELERADISELTKAGWRAPEVFTSLARDGKTDIWGIIFRPTNFDPLKKYPVIENIYAGPHSSFVPKNFAPWNPMQSLAELGFIVVQIDGMGTSNRSKAFHDVAWKNLGDAGFPDRILWHKAVAAKYPYYDITRVGIYGTSAGGQNSLGALLFHPEFYKACVSACGCHDNRMDKIWWNEQWMGWPLGPEYATASNVDNAYKLQGKLLLILGEMDTNVDPASTMQVVNALIKADKQFDLLVIPGANHGAGGAYGEKKRNDFFVHHLLGVEPPDWNKVEKNKPMTADGN